MASTDFWAMTHQQRRSVADLLETLTPEQWEQTSLCAGWSVRDLVAHMIATGHTTPGSFVRGFVASGFRFSVFSQRQIAERRDQPTTQLVEQLRETATMTAHPPGPPQTPLSEIVVHGADIARPLALPYEPPRDALVAVAEFYKGAQPLIGAKKRIAGLHLTGTDTGWQTGAGPEVSGPTLALLLAMAGRSPALEDLEGPGVTVLRSRMP